MTSTDQFAYPPITQQSKIWTRWWWLGSAVDKANLTRLLSEYHDANIGGVEICPIYGAKGQESRYLQYLSPEWMQMFAHTTAEAKRLDIGVDLTDGTGWPYGGANVTADDASCSVILKHYGVASGMTLMDALPSGQIQHVRAISATGTQIDLTDKVKDAHVDWTAPAGEWKLYVIAIKQPIQKVKRAAPGAEGNVLDPYSVSALDHYLSGFDKAFELANPIMPRAHFHDSFEYYGASWTPQFFDEFNKRRGYDLRTQLPALMDQGDAETIARVKCDYRETINDLHLAYIQRWTKWSHKHNGLSRNQAHGAPGNLLDIYAAADIPETEIFGDVPDSEFVRIKFATSAAHLNGTTLASSESFTWLGEHFQVALSDLKHPTDFLFLTGINHLFFHGIPYSPDNVEWPGWLFYASVHFGPQGGLWRDLPAFNAYVARCQSFLQAGESDNDLLLYFPQYEMWQKPEKLMVQASVHHQEDWLTHLGFYKTANDLQQAGFSYDIISDRFIASAKVENGAVVVGNQRYAALVVPATNVMQHTTLRKLISLADQGAKIIFQDKLPGDVPGLSQLSKRRTALIEVRKLQEKLVITDDLHKTLGEIGVPRETMIASGLHHLRRKIDGGWQYFIVNRSDKRFDGFAPIATSAKSAILFDPMSADRSGLAALKQSDKGAQVYLQLEPGESCIVRIMENQEITGRKWIYENIAGESIAITGEWQVKFIDGGPVLPKEYQTNELQSWTMRDDPEAKRFCGSARYTIHFNRPAAAADDWQLNLGKICDSARVKINGTDLGTRWCKPFVINIGKHLKDGDNTLEIEVTNVAANRIADADRRGVPWKAFHEINFVNKDYKPFDASNWPLRDSGLIGPVSLTPLKHVEP